MQLLITKGGVSPTRAATALVLSVVADVMEFLEIPLLAVPFIGEIPTVAVGGALFAITRNKRSAALNLIKLIPVLGSIVPIYTITTLIWIYSESRKQKYKKVL